MLTLRPGRRLDILASTVVTVPPDQDGAASSAPPNIGKGCSARAWVTFRPAERPGFWRAADPI
jgi:hypothetical protein